MCPDQTDLYSQIRELLVDLLGVDPAGVHPETRLIEDLEADELDLIEIVMLIEDTYGLEIPDEDLIRSGRTKGGNWRLTVSSSGELFAGDWKLRTVDDLERYDRQRL